MSSNLFVIAASLVLLLVELAVIVRVILRPHRQPASRIAWIAVIAALPVAGILAYLLFGEVNIGRLRAARRRRVINEIVDLSSALAGTTTMPAEVAERYAPLFRVGQSISLMGPISGNTAQLLADSNATIYSLVADIDAAKHHVHVLFYIWLPDGNGCRVVEALKRAAQRGVQCRVMADDIGSRLLIHSPHWQSMREAGVQLAAALPVGNPLLRLFKGRIDLRNHRKIIVIDGIITYCGSQNCADPEFRIKAKYAPWIDIMLRFEGPIAAQNQRLFASDWMSHVDEDLAELLRQPVKVTPESGFTAQVIATGPTVRYSAMPELFESLIYNARHELVVTTPYYVPDESMQNALCAAAYRGVETTLIFPARNDSWVVAAASRSYYADLLSSGIKIYEYEHGLLHAKTLTLDGEVALVGSSNMDRRSFDLNYENNIMFYDTALTAEVRQRQQQYIDQSRLVRLEEVATWPTRRRLWNNIVAMLGPLL